MTVRVRIKLSRNGFQVSTVAIANSGYESDSPEIVLPVKAAERLKLYPELPAGSRVEEYRGVGGVIVKTFVIRDSVNVCVVTEDRESQTVKATAVITPGEDEVVISDKLIDSLGLVLIRSGEGLWRFIDDNSETIRRSLPAEKW